MLNIITFNVFLYFIIFDTNVIYEYAKYIPFLKKILLLEEYENFIRSNEPMLYLTYLRLFKPNFFIRLITCPFCLGFWSILLQSFIFKFNPFLVYIIVMSIYKIFVKISKI